MGKSIVSIYVYPCIFMYDIYDKYACMNIHMYVYMSCLMRIVSTTDLQVKTNQQASLRNGTSTRTRVYNCNLGIMFGCKRECTID